MGLRLRGVFDNRVVRSGAVAHSRQAWRVADHSGGLLYGARPARKRGSRPKISIVRERAGVAVSGGRGGGD